jgi:uncharacterized protein (DUF302 family)
MNAIRALVALAFFATYSIAAAADGLVAMKSPYNARETMNRLEENVKERGLTVFARIDHAAGAQKAGQILRPTELLIFGNPKIGASLMQCAQTAGIDLPLKALVWKDAANQVWLGYNDPVYLAHRHAAADCPVVRKMRKALADLAEATIRRR